nr:cis-polyprenylcistransferase [Chondrilla juncea]
MRVNPIITADTSLKQAQDIRSNGMVGKFLGGLNSTIRKLIFRAIAARPIPEHIAFILDGNRRFARKHKLSEGGGHKTGFLALMSVLKYCCEIGVKYVTIYAFSLDNFNRRPDEVQYVMDLMQDKIEGFLMQDKIEGFLKELSIINKYGVRVLFIGDLDRLYEPVRVAAEKAMEATAKNSTTYLLVCVAYTSSHEIPRAVYEACEEKSGATSIRVMNGINGNIGGNYGGVIKVMDVEKHMYMGVAPDPDILVRSSGETRLSNFLLWQTTNCLLYSPKALWPEMGFWQVVWGILEFQNNYNYLEKKKKQA